MSLQVALMDLSRLSFAMEFTLEEVERLVRRQVVVAVLERNEWNQCRAAKKLGVHRNTLRRIMQECDIQMPSQNNPQRSTDSTRFHVEHRR